MSVGSRLRRRWRKHWRASGGPPPPPPPTNNTASVIVDEGPSNNSVNTLFTSVTVCVPGSTTSCQTIDHIQVDTGSYGLRILAPVLTGLTTLPVETLASGNSLAECTQFVDGYSWGPVATADIQIAGETAHSLPVQVIGDSRFTNIPAGLFEHRGTARRHGSGLRRQRHFRNRAVRVGLRRLRYRRLTACITPAPRAARRRRCRSIMQVPNPVTHFAADNNGAIIVMPSVAAGGASNVMGSLIFGIDTQTDNASGTQTVLTVDDNAELLVTFNGQTLANSFIDSGSNGIYFTDSKHRHLHRSCPTIRLRKS